MPTVRAKVGAAARRAAREARERDRAAAAAAAAEAERANPPADGLVPPVHGRTAGPSGTENPAGENAALDKERAVADRIEISHAEAVKILEDIGKQFVSLRNEGRSGAWASLEDKLALNAHVFISAGLMSPKDLIGMMTEIESFRKSEGGTQQAPGDFLAEWLNGEDKPEKKPGKKKVA